MVDVREIKSFKLTPFTKMSASIYGILGLIGSILMLIVLAFLQATGVIHHLGQFNLVTGLGIPLIVLLPIGAFLSTIVVSFVSVMLYNALVPKLGGVKLELEGNEVENIPVISFSLILSAIEAIWAFVVGLVLAAVISPLFSLIGAISTMPAAANITANITNVSGATMPTGAEIGTAGILMSLVLIIGLPIIVFVFGFIWNALFAILYNYIVTRVAKIQLEFGQITGNLHELKHIPVLPTALAVALVYMLLGLIGILSGNYGEFISNFIIYFIETALIAILYNYLAPKIGSIKLNLE
ncbi:hypothetical protein [Methanobacterium formicicum]|uniref:DUF4013 domain-containing protein n=1 Tax=Methanobacterium formicicum (strain DSM 3637 / PP1) TaxID=1204725 RepID=K2R353_METFP|nr:hypothetical protein [Methanobacterium formicicum]EKF85667.1 hypothetical protein A994_08041 [Methanobacterium formicicum DSM 3637]